MTIHNKIWRGVAELLAAHNTGDDKRGDAGQEIIRQALAEISVHENSGQLAELNAAGMKMLEIVTGKLTDDDMRAFLTAREKHQIALSNLARQI